MKLSAILSSAFLAFLLTACGSNSKTLDFFIVDNGKQETFNQLAQKFCTEKKNKVQINVISHLESKNYLRAVVAHGELPDIIAMDGDSIYSELAGEKQLLDLSNEPWIPEIHEKYLDTLFSLNGRTDSHVYALPYAVNVSGIIYNKDIFKNEGLEVPETWDDFVAVCDKLQKRGIQPIAMMLHNTDSWASLPPWNNMVPILVPPKFVEDRRNDKTTFGQTHREVLEKYITILKYSRGNDYLSTGYLEGIRYFAQGKAAMIINGCWAVPMIKKVNPTIDIDMMAFPTCNEIQKNTLNSGIDINLIVSAKCKNPKLARQFLEFMARSENAQFYIDHQFSYSAIKGVEQKDSSCESANALIEQGRISDFPDHYYPLGFDLASSLVRFAVNYTKGVPDSSNITVTLRECDENYDALNQK